MNEDCGEKQLIMVSDTMMDGRNDLESNPA